MHTDTNSYFFTLSPSHLISFYWISGPVLTGTVTRIILISVSLYHSRTLDIVARMTNNKHRQSEKAWERTK